MAVVVEAVSGLVAAAMLSSDDDTTTASPATTTSEPRRPRTTTSTTTPRTDRDAVFDEIRAQVAEIRDLEWKEEVTIRVAPQPEVGRRLQELVAREVDPADLAAEESALELLGLIPEDFDYADEILEAVGDAVFGYYDTETKELLVSGRRDGPVIPLTRLIVAHELTHALTDQHFQWGEATEVLVDEDRGEEATAMQALFEGDATFVEEEWTSRHLTARERGQLSLGAFGGGDPRDVPRFLLEVDAFPYISGREFVAALHRRGGFAAVNDAYRRPPTSTEHIRHPVRYVENQAPTPPPLPDVAGATGCEELLRDMLGEFGMEQILLEHLSNSAARRAADGWNGDAMAVVRCGRSRAFVDRWETDPGTDPARLAAALAEWAAEWSGSGDAPQSDGRFSGPSGAGRVSVVGSRVELVIADDTATVDRVLEALG